MSKGIQNKYIITRTDGEKIDVNNEYFVLKLNGAGDTTHINACRKAIVTYANEIKNHLPILAHELLTKYS